LDCAGLEEVFELDPFDTVVGQEEIGREEEVPDGDRDSLSDLSSEAEDPDGPTNNPGEFTTDFHHIKDMVNKLDTILTLVFDHLNRPSLVKLVLPIDSSPSGSPPSTPLTSENHPSTQPQNAMPLDPELEKVARRLQFHALLSIFDRAIIRTFKSRYTQFLVFWYTSLDPEFSDLFQGMLVEKALLDENLPMVTRIAASSYISSFVSRATFVDRESTRNVVSVLCDFLTNRMDTLDHTLRVGSELSGTHTGMFYAVCQAVFLVFCFRWRDLIEDRVEDMDELAELHADSPAKKWLPKLYVLERAVSSLLNPLKVGRLETHAITRPLMTLHSTVLQTLSCNLHG
jgi:RNA polymerase I-specific transcription initiation factor RRN3